MEKKLVNDLWLRCNGNHLVVVSALFFDQTSLMRESAPLRKYHQDAECYSRQRQNEWFFTLFKPFFLVTFINFLWRSKNVHIEQDHSKTWICGMNFQMSWVRCCPPEISHSDNYISMVAKCHVLSRRHPASHHRYKWQNIKYGSRTRSRWLSVNNTCCM